VRCRCLIWFESIEKSLTITTVQSKTFDPRPEAPIIAKTWQMDSRSIDVQEICLTPMLKGRPRRNDEPKRPIAHRVRFTSKSLPEKTAVNPVYCARRILAVTQHAVESV